MPDIALNADATEGAAARLGHPPVNFDVRSH